MADDIIATDLPEVDLKPAPKAKPAKKEKALVLDESLPFGRVYGAPGVVYCQDGNFFDGKGNLTQAPV